MLLLSFGVLVLTALLGGVLAALHLQVAAAHSQPSWPLRALHGLLGASGLVTLLVVLRGPPRGEAMGIGSFGLVAAALLALALLTGLAMQVARLFHWRTPHLAIGIHATIAVSGVVILAAYVLIG
jgi:hypothetical protein